MDERKLPRLSGAATRSILRTVLRLALVSLLVGVLLAVFGWNPVELWQGLWRALRTGVVDLFGTGRDGVALVITLIATGAVIVVPLWVVSKLMRSRR